MVATLKGRQDRRTLLRHPERMEDAAPVAPRVGVLNILVVLLKFSNALSKNNFRSLPFNKRKEI
jgi:hypothetical protein